MKKSTLIMILSLVLAVALGVGGTLAYLTDTDADVNVMVMGDVQVQQNEQQRIEQGNAAAGLEEFEQYQTLLPYVTIGATTKEDVVVGDYTIKMRDESVKNYVDKIVTVTNTGSNDAFVRTIIAIPTGGYELHDASTQWLHYNVVSDTDTNPNNGWFYGKNSSVLNELLIGEDGELPAVEYSQPWEDWDKVDKVTINGLEYKLIVVTNKNVLKPGETTGPNLAGIYMDKNVDKDSQGYYITVDGTRHYIDVDPTKVEVLVATQAVQAGGFEEAGAWYALDAAFGDISATNHPWSKGMPEVGSPGDKWDTNNPPEGIYSLSDLVAAANNGGTYKLCVNLTITEDDVSEFRSGRKITAVMKDFTLDLGGHDITVDLGDGEYADANNPPTLFYVYSNATFTLKGDGNLNATNDACLVWATSTSKGTNIYGGNFTNDNFSTGGSGSMANVYTSGGPVNVYGGSFTFEITSNDSTGFNVQNSNWYTNEIVLHEGVLLSSEKFCQDADEGKIALAEGCTLEEVVIDGVTWYQVVKN